MILKLNDIEVIFTRKSIKNNNLRIHANGKIQLSAPHAFSRTAIESFLQEKQEWIEKQQDRLKKKQNWLPLAYKTGERHYFLGKAYTLIMHEGADAPSLTLENENLHCRIPKASKQSSKQILYAWYLVQMQAILPDLVEKWRKIIDVPPVICRIKTMKSLWGSCHPQKKQITINLQLIRKPLVCIEYVIVHELLHLLETGHNQRFYGLMDAFMPEWKTYKSLLLGSPEN